MAYPSSVEIGDFIIARIRRLQITPSPRFINVAARLEGLAKPGTVCISRTVFNHVKGKVELGFEDLGEHKVKNITDPVHVYGTPLDVAVFTGNQDIADLLRQHGAAPMSKAAWPSIRSPLDRFARRTSWLRCLVPHRVMTDFVTILDCLPK